MALEKKIPNAHEGAMTCIQWNQDGLSLATAGEDGTLTLWSKAGNVRRSFSYAHSIYAISWGGSSNGTILYQNYQNYQESLVVAHGTTLSIVSCHDNTNHSDCLEWDIYHHHRNHHHHHSKSSSDSTHNNNNENSSSRSRSRGSSRSSSSSKSSSKGVILALDWNKTHHSILCGGEDCRYRIYNPQGVLLYVSEIHLHVITSLKWRPISHAHSCQISHEHHVFVVGTFEDVYLCDATGWKRHYNHNHKHNHKHNHSSCHCHNLLQNHGSVTCLEWNVTGTQVWGTCGDGSVWKGDLVGQCQEWGPLSATLVDPYTITVTNFANSKEFVQDVTFASPIVDFGIASYTLVVCTTQKCHVTSLQHHSHSNSNLSTSTSTSTSTNTSAVIDQIYDKVIVSTQNMALFSRTTQSVMIYTLLLEGGTKQQPRLCCAPIRFQGMQINLMNKDNIALSPDTIAFIDPTDSKVIRLFDCSTATSIHGIGNNHHNHNHNHNHNNTSTGKEIRHDMDIVKICLSQCGTTQQDRRLLFLDRKEDLFISPVITSSSVVSLSSSSVVSSSNYRMGSRSNTKHNNSNHHHNHTFIHKLSAQVKTMAWNDSSNIVIAITGDDSSLIKTWYYPNAPFIDKDLLHLACDIQTHGSKYGGTSPYILYFVDTTWKLRHSENGSHIEATTSPYPVTVYQLASSGKWKQALRVCRLANDEKVWAMMAGLAMEYNDLNVAEMAWSAIRQVDKLQYIQYIQNIKHSDRRNAEIFLYKRCPEEAISTLLQAQPHALLYYAVKMYIRLFEWEKALELAVTHPNNKNNISSLIEIVLWYRKQYLSDMEMMEENVNFIKFNNTLNVDELTGNVISKMKEKARLNEE